MQKNMSYINERSLYELYTNIKSKSDLKKDIGNICLEVIKCIISDNNESDTNNEELISQIAKLKVILNLFEKTIINKKIYELELQRQFRKMKIDILVENLKEENEGTTDEDY